MSLGYALQMSRRGFRLPFGGVVGKLPKWLRESEAGKGLRTAGFSLVPTSVRWSSILSRDQSDYTSFAVPIARSDDAGIRPTLALTHLWRNSAGLTWQPLGMLTMGSDLTSTRDLRVYSDSTSLGRLAYQERRFLFGIPVGVERDRTLTTSLSLTPKISSWLRPRLVTGSSFVLSRTLNSRATGSGGRRQHRAVHPAPDAQQFALARDRIGLRSLARAQADHGRQQPGGAGVRAHPAGRPQREDHAELHLRSRGVRPEREVHAGAGRAGDFLNHDGVNALGVTDGRTTTLAGGADLPFGLAGTLSTR